MLDEKDIEKIQSMIDQAKDDMLKQSAANTRVIIESSVMKKLDLLIEGQQALLDTLAPKSRVEELEEEVSFRNLSSVCTTSASRSWKKRSNSKNRRPGHSPRPSCVTCCLSATCQYPWTYPPG